MQMFTLLTGYYEPPSVESQATVSTSCRWQVSHQLPGAFLVLLQGLRRCENGATHIVPP